MASNAQKTPIARSLNLVAEGRVAQAIQLQGKALPCSVVAVSGSIVTVSFQLTNIPFTLPNVTVPEFGPEYIRYPTQVGDLGVVLPIDTYLGGISGLGGGVADLSMRANLSSLVFFPVGNKGWTAPTDPNKIELYGPDGAILRTKDSTSSVTVQVSNHTNVVLPATKTVVFEYLPTSAVGLPSGAIWRNGSGVAIVP